MASTAPARRARAGWTSGQARSRPAARRRGASLGSQELRAWGSPSVGRGTPSPGGEHGVPRSGCSTANGRAARWHAGRRAQEEGPGSVWTGPSLDAAVSQRAKRWHPRHAGCHATRGSRGWARRSAWRLNRTLGRGHGRTRPRPGIHKAGHDCDASEAGLQGGQTRRRRLCRRDVCKEHRKCRAAAALLQRVEAAIGLAPTARPVDAGGLTVANKRGPAPADVSCPASSTRMTRSGERARRIGWQGRILGRWPSARRAGGNSDIVDLARRQCSSAVS